MLGSRGSGGHAVRRVSGAVGDGSCAVRRFAAVLCLQESHKHIAPALLHTPQRGTLFLQSRMYVFLCPLLPLPHPLCPITLVLQAAAAARHA
jgi:hypothetical protein